MATPVAEAPSRGINARNCRALLTLFRSCAYAWETPRLSTWKKPLSAMTYRDRKNRSSGGTDRTVAGGDGVCVSTNIFQEEPKCYVSRVFLC